MNPTPGPFPAEIVELERAECLQLLAAESFGRIAVNVPDWGPLIRPVNYVFDKPSQSVIVRSAKGTKLHGMTRAARAAFEIDSIDSTNRTGWSVIIVGVAEEINNAAELRRLEGLGLDVWAPGPKEHWIRIRARTVSGRRIAPAQSPCISATNVVGV
jgi:hypothetical protein